jgi:spermidine/putrescine transport system substrate-binding protein
MTQHRGQHSRRDFLRRAGGTAVALPSLAAILAACSKPGVEPAGSGGQPLARPEDPVTIPFNADPISADTPIETGATLQVFNWDNYIYRAVIADFEKEFECEVEYTSFKNMEEGISRLTSGQVQPDVFFPTVDYVTRLAAEDLIQPLQHNLIPNMEEVVWRSYWDPGPWYDLEWRYTVPYTIYTTGVAYRRDQTSDEEAAEQGYDLLWNPEFSGKISYYDSYRDAIGMALQRLGYTDPHTDDPAQIDAARDSILELVTELDARLTTNGTWRRLPEGEFWVSQGWSGDIVAGKWYLAGGATEEDLGYWYPEDNKGLIGNDTMTIPTASQSPRLAHEFINFFLDARQGYRNFVNWNGYQPPFVTIQPETLISDGIVSPTLERAVVTEEMFTQGYQQGQLTAEVDGLWLDAWDQIKAGG